MRQIAAFEAKNTLGSLLDLVEKGEEVTITRHGRPVARLVAPMPDRDPKKAQRAIDEIRAMRKGVTLDGLKIRDLIDEGRL